MIAGLVLAAGAGTRFGPEPKLLVRVAGMPLLEHAVAAVCSVEEIDRVVVVLGAHADDLLERVRFGRAEPVVCADWAQGQSVSLRCGAAAASEAERLIVTLGDEPTITREVIERFVAEPGGTRASYNGRPGHPVVLGPEQLRALSGLEGDTGARELLRGARMIECSDLTSGNDVDTQQDLEALRRES